MSVLDKTGSIMAGADGVAMAQTDDLKHILQQITGQIASVEQRHAESMRDMQQRLASLTTQAKQTLLDSTGEQSRTSAQNATRLSISRIEGGIAGLAELITESTTARRVHRDAVVSHHDFSQSTADVPEPWDPSSAEALTRLYETGDAGPVMTSYFFQDPPASPRNSESSPAHQLQSSPVHISEFAIHDRSRSSHYQQAFAAPVAPSHQPHVAKSIDSSEVLAKLASDRDWLEGRLADIAIRVEASLSSFKPEESLGQLHTRFDEFESRFTDAMSAVAQRSDLDGLVHLEAHIAELTQQFETTKAQFARLDEIEQQLRDLTAYAQEATEVPAMASPVSEPTPLPDFGELAEITAARVSERLAALPRPDTANVNHFERVHNLLTEYMADRRRDESQTSGMLDTMQEALVRLIDRVDQMDATLLRSADPVAVVPASAPPQGTPSTGPDGLRYVEDERGQHPGRRGGDLQSSDGSPNFVHPASPSQLQPQQHQLQPAGRPPTAEVAAPTNTGAPWPQNAARPHEPETGEAQRLADSAPGRTRRRATLEPLNDAPTSPPPQAPSAPAPVAQPVGQPQGKPQPRPRPVPAPATIVAPEAKTASDSIRKRGLMIAGIAFGLIAIGTISAKVLTDQLDRSRTKQEQRVPIAGPSNPAGIRALSPAFESDTPAATPSIQDALPADQKTIPASQRGIADDRMKPQPEPRELPRPSSGGRQPSEAKNPAPQLRPVPETVTDDLSENSKGDGVARGRAAIGMPGLMVAPSVQGIALQQRTGGLSPIDLAQLQQRQLGQTSRAPDANAASMSTASLQKPTTTIAAESHFDPLLNGTGAAGVTAVEMPPLLIGPSSLRTAAQRGDPAAQFEIAARFAEGKGVKQDFKQAMIWYQRSAQVGFAPSQYRLATLYERGLGGKADQDRARDWYKRAADQGNVKAMHNLAVLSTGRDNVAPDYAAAAQWFTEAADRGLADSQFNLGVLYENGLGVQKDQSEAFKWFALAAQGGDKEALKRRDYVGARMQPDDAKIAEAKVAGWRARPVDLKVNDARVAGDAWRAQSALALEAAQAAVAPSTSRNVLPTPSSAQRPLPTVRYGTPPATPPKSVQNQ
jgi:localization factor PodJL